MMKAIQNSSKLITLALLLIICLAGCKSKKKAMEASNAAAEKARIEQEAANLRKQKEKDEELKKQEAEDLARREADAKQAREREKENEAKISSPKAKLGQYFSAIAGSPSLASANSSINEALTLFASQETPVLVVISESGGQKDYDRPTTIKSYLNYLKDQKKNLNSISNLQFDASGKITEVELRKN